MRFFISLLVYLVGVSVVTSIGIVGLMVLSSTSETPSAPITSAASHYERLAVKQTIATQKKAPPDQKKKRVYITRKPRYEAPITAEASYGYAEEPRRHIDPNLFSIFGRTLTDH